MILIYGTKQMVLLVNIMMFFPTFVFYSLTVIQRKKGEVLSSLWCCLCRRHGDKL